MEASAFRLLRQGLPTHLQGRVVYKSDSGSIAKVFEKIGGEVVYFGKPYKEIYKSILKEKDKALIIGDNLRTDIKGANLIKQDSLFIIDGVHKNEIKGL